MVWKETLHTYREMIAAEGWSDKAEIEIPAVQTLTFKVSSTSHCRLPFFFKNIPLSLPARPTHHRKVRVRVRLQLGQPSQIR